MIAWNLVNLYDSCATFVKLHDFSVKFVNLRVSCVKFVKFGRFLCEICEICMFAAWTAWNFIFVQWTLWTYIWSWDETPISHISRPESPYSRPLTVFHANFTPAPFWRQTGLISLRSLISQALSPEAVGQAWISGDFLHQDLPQLVNQRSDLGVCP